MNCTAWLLDGVSAQEISVELKLSTSGLQLVDLEFPHLNIDKSFVFTKDLLTKKTN